MVGTERPRSKILDMIALDAGEAADFLAGAWGAEFNPACEDVQASKGPAAERAKDPSSRRLKIRVDGLESGRPRVSVGVSDREVGEWVQIYVE